MKFDFGNEVEFGTKDDTGNVIEKLCVIVGITSIGTKEQAKVFGYPMGTVLYTVEFGDGTDLLVPESELRDVE